MYKFFLFVFLYCWYVLISPIKCFKIAYRKVSAMRLIGMRDRDRLPPPPPPWATRGKSHVKFTGPGSSDAPKKRKRRGHRGGRKHKRHH
jgi:hypothetical protein